MPFRRSTLCFGIAAGLAIAGAGSMVVAQTGGGAGGPVDSGGASFEVTGIQVDVRGKDAQAARIGGWRVAQRRGWEMLSQRLTGRKSTLSDSALDALVSGIVVENEQIGPNRYIARLGVLFDRNRAAALLGVSARFTRSAPMLLVPVEWSGGVGRVFESDGPWQRAWSRFRAGNSAIDYVRPRGNGPDALLINAGQIGRPGRNWWRGVLDQYGATDILVAEVQLRPDYPGGPVTAVFTASHGPDKVRVAQFALRVDNAAGLDSLLDQGIQRIDQAFQSALTSGRLRTDTLLAFRPPDPDAVEEEEVEEAVAPTPTPSSAPTTTATSFTVQVDTPSAASVSASEAAVRGVPGVRSAVTTSLALGGISVMRVSYDGSLDGLRAALEARGWNVQQGPGVLRIRRGGAGESPAGE